MGDTSISWTMDDEGVLGKTWNCIRGCSDKSEGCRNCYAKRIAARFSDPGQPYEGLAIRKRTAGGRYIPQWTGEVRLVPEHLADPLRWRKPRRIFVNSMSDLFHEKLTNEQIAAVFGVMAAAPQHTFQVLTKRAKRMREWFAWLDDATDNFGPPRAEICGIHAVNHCVDIDSAGLPQRWPLPNVWLGVSVENQEAADDRIPELLATPAAVRFLSCEPLIAALRLHEWLGREHGLKLIGALPGLRWIIAGCESGPGARECDVAWLRSLRDQCANAGVAFFLKQAEESADCGDDGLLDAGDNDSVAFGDGSKMKARRPSGNHIIELPYLDGAQHKAFPEVER